MAKLIAHLPLNGTRDDITGNGFDLYNDIATIDNNGKIGKCFSYDGATQYSKIPALLPTGTLKNEFSVAFWIYPTSDVWTTLASPASYGIDHFIEYNGTTQAIGARVCENSDLNQRTNYSTNGSVPQNKWTHVGFTMDDLNIKVYINGLLDSEYTHTAPIMPWLGYWRIGCRDNITYFFGGKLNDFRFYDGILSDKEIYEISKAKLLHYKFNEFAEPVINFIGNGDFSSGQGVENVYGSYGTYEVIEKNNPGNSNYVLSQLTGEYEIHIKDGYSIEPDTYYTMSCWVGYTADWDGDTQIFHARWYNTDTTNNTSGGAGTLVETKEIDGITWEKRYLTFQTGPLANGAFSWYLGYSAQGTTGMRYLTDVQLVKKPYPMPEFIKDEGKNKIIDHSGFGNHATLAMNTTPRWTEDGIRGSGCYEFTPLTNASTTDTSKGKHIKCDSVGMPNDEFTITFWSNRTVGGYQGGSYVSFGNTVGGFDTRDNFFTVVNADSQAEVARISMESNAGSLQHHTIVWKASDANQMLRHYINGVEDNTGYGTPGGGAAGNLKHSTLPFTIGCSTAGGLARFFNGKMDDVRFYATALSSDEIAKLYKNVANLDNQGNLSSYELHTGFIEDDVNGTNIEVGGWAYDDGYGAYAGFRIDGIEKSRKHRGHCLVVLDNKLNVYQKAVFDTHSGLQYDTVYNPDGSVLYDYASETATQADSIAKLKKYLLSIPDGYLVGVFSYDYLGWDTELYDMMVEMFNIKQPQVAITGRTNWAILAQKNGRKFFEVFAPDDAGAVKSSVNLRPAKSFVPNSKGTMEAHEISTVGITDGLIGYWPLQGDCKDYSGGGNHGTPLGYGGASAPYYNGSGYVFSNTSAGVGNYIKGNVKYQEDNLTISATIVHGGASGGGMHHIASMGDNDWNPQIANSATPVAAMYMDGPSVSTATGVIVPGQKQHIVMSVEKLATDSSNVKIYVDGQLVKEQTIAADLNDRTYPNPFVIGMDWDGSNPSDSFNGEISHVKLFNRPFTDEEAGIEYKHQMGIKALMQNASGTIFVKGISDLL